VVVLAVVVVALVVVVPVVDGSFNLQDGVELFNSGKYFEAHDYFEELWMLSKGESKLFYQGLVQISVGSYHLLSNNYKGALSQLKKGKEKLEKFPDSYEEINLKQFRQDINYLFEEITVFYSKKNYNFRVLKIPFIELNA